MTNQHTESETKTQQPQRGNGSALSGLVIRQTPLGGWKGSAVVGAACLLIMVFAASKGDVGEFLLSIAAACGWFGWSVQERQHLSGYRIDDV